jgi:transmembrane sensor
MVKVNSPASAPSAAPAAEAQLGAGQRAVVSMADSENPVPPVVETVSAAEIKQALAWQGGLVFDATPLSQVVIQFNRRNARQLVIVEPELGALRISGRFRADSVDGFAELMESSFGVVVTPHGNDLLLSKHP